MKRYSFLLLIAIIILGACLRLYRLSETNILPGDAERDLLIARDIILYHQYPLIGPPTSLGWLYLSLAIYYLWATILYIGRLSFIFPAIFTILMDIVAIYFFYKLGKLAFDEKTGILSALFYASSPYLIIHSSVPLHVNLMPLFAVLFYLFLFNFFENQKPKYYLLSWVMLGILLHLHATAIILMCILLILTYKKTKHRLIFTGLEIFTVIISPWIVSALLNNNLQMIGKLLVWFPYRISSAVGFITDKNLLTMEKLIQAFNTITAAIQSIIFIPDRYIALIIFISCIIIAILKRKELKFINLILAVFFTGLLIHGQPSEQYFIAFVPMILLFIAFILSRKKIGRAVAFFIVLFNILFTISFSLML